MPANPPRHDRTGREPAVRGGVATMVTEAVTAEDDEQLRRLQAVTDSALAQLDVDELLSELTARIRELMGTDTSAILLLDGSGRELVAAAASGLEEEVRQGIRIPLG